MNWGPGTTYSTFTMRSEDTRALAIADLQSMGYACSVEDTDGQILVDVDHARDDAATVRWTVLRADPRAMVVRR